MDLRLDKDLQPVWLDTKDYDTVDGREEFEQWIRINSIGRLYGIISEYDSNDIPQKIELELTRLARDSDYIDTVPKIEVNNVDAGYEVRVKYSEVDEFELLLDRL